MNDIVQLDFSYESLPAPVALEVRAAAERIKVRLKRTVEDIIEIGRELTEVKGQLPHGQFLPWVAAEFEMTAQTAQNFIRVHERFGDQKQNYFVFQPTVLYALSAPSTPDSVTAKALEKAESGEKVTVADVKDWKAEYEEEMKRSQEWKEQSQLFKKKADEQATQLAVLEKKHRKEIDQQVKAKLLERQRELNEIENTKRLLQKEVDDMKEYLGSLNSRDRRNEAHRSTIDSMRLPLIDLAAFLDDMDPMEDEEILHHWRKLADQLRQGANAIEFVFGPPKLRVVS